MKLKKVFAAAASCLAAAFLAVLPASAAFTDTSDSVPPVTTLPALQAPAPTLGSVPTLNFNTQFATSAGGGAVLGNSTQTDSASTGDNGIVLAVAGLFITTGVGAAAVALRNKKK